MKAKIMCVLVLLALALGALAAPYGSEAATRAIAETYKIDDITYYNVNSPNFNSDKKFYVDMISTKHTAIGGRSLGDLWLMAAAGIGKEVAYQAGMLMESPEKILAHMKQGLLTGKITTEDVGLPSLQTIYKYSAPEWLNYDGGYVETSAALEDFIGSKFSVTVRFSDFKVGALIPADQGLYTSTTTETSSPQDIEASSVKNDTNETINATQGVSRTVEESVESTVDHSSSYSFTEGLKVGMEAGISEVFKITGELSAEFSQAFEDGWSKSEGKSKSKTVNSDVNVTLPPYTTVLIKQGEAETTTTTNYNCPVIVGYKVTIIVQGFLLNPVYTFGSSNSNARKDLFHRAFDEGSKSLDTQKVDWETILADSDFKDAIQKITKNVPMSSSGASVTYTAKTTYSEVAGKAALYPLTTVKLEHPNVSFIDDNNTATMKIGQYSCVDYLPLKGYNTHDAEYYGFNKNKGHWIVVDENMRELSGSSAPVVLKKDNVTGDINYTAVNEGKCYLKYVIDENVYPTEAGGGKYTKNADIKTAVLPITVTDGITYEITGDYTGIVGAAPENIEGDGKLRAGVFDADDLEIDREYIWQARDKASRGIKLTSDGMISFTKPATFKVRIKDKYEKLYSEWKVIKAEVLGDDYVAPEDDTPAATEYAEEETTFVITGKYVGGVSSDRESLDGIGKLNVAAYDDSGQELAVLYSWEARDVSDGMTLTEDGQVSFTKTGSYYVRVKSGSVYSEWIEVDANEKAPARFTHVPTSTGNAYTGEAVNLLAGDARCEGGTVVYALGTDETTAPKQYSSELPTAINTGTYYVWCKVLGDANHDNSEPVCVVATIGEVSDEGTDSRNTSSNDGGNGGSSSGCDAGISALSLGVIVMLLKRKA